MNKQVNGDDKEISLIVVRSKRILVLIVILYFLLFLFLKLVLVLTLMNLFLVSFFIFFIYSFMFSFRVFNSKGHEELRYLYIGSIYYWFSYE